MPEVDAALETESTSPPEGLEETPEASTPEQPEAEATPDPESEETSPPPDDDLFTVKVDGQELQVPYDELVNGYQRQASFTRKSQELAEEKAQAATAVALWEKLQEDPQAAIEALQEHFADAVSAEVDPEAARITRLERTLEQQQQAELDRQLKGWLDELEAEHGEFDRDALVEFAIDHKVGKLEDALFLKQRADEKATRDKGRLRAKQGAPPIDTRGSQAADSLSADESFDTFEEALESAMKEHKVTDLSTLLS